MLMKTINDDNNTLPRICFANTYFRQKNNPQVIMLSRGDLEKRGQRGFFSKNEGRGLLRLKKV